MASDDFLTWCDDLHQVKGNISQLQATLNHVLNKAPSVAQYKHLDKVYSQGAAEAADQPLMEKLHTSLQSPQVKVAVRIKSLFDRGYLPFLKTLTKINFKSPKVDRYVGYLLDYQPSRKDIKAIGPEDPPKKHDKSAVGDDHAPYPPSLPPLENSLLLRLVLTDKSLRQPSDYLELETDDGHHDFNNNHNRKLSLHGARLLDMALLDVLDETFPKAHEDDLEYLRYKLTNGHLLANLSYCYNFPESVMHNVSKELTSKEKLSIFKNVFLAYLGAMSKSDYSYDEIKMWVGKLYGPVISRLHEESSQQGKLRNPYEIANAEFRFLVDRDSGFLSSGRKKINYEFEFNSEESPLTCQLSVGDIKLGIGIGVSYVEAKKKAMFATFEDKELRTKFFEYLLEHYASGESKENNKPETTTQQNLAEGGDDMQDDNEDNEDQEIEIAYNEQSTQSKADDPEESDDEAYSPVLNGEDGIDSAPEVTQPPSTSTEALAGFETASSTTFAPTAPTAPTTAATTATTTAPTMNSVSSTSTSASPSTAPTAPTPSPSSESYARMPLPYGVLPPIPNLKKRGPRR